MPALPISGLPAATKVSNADLLAIEQAGVTLSATKALVLTAAPGEPIILLGDPTQYLSLDRGDGFSFLNLDLAGQGTWQMLGAVEITAGNNNSGLTMALDGTVEISQADNTVFSVTNFSFTMQFVMDGVAGTITMIAPNGVITSYVPGNPSDWPGVVPSDVAGGLDELAAIITTIIATYATLNNPTFTGIPRAPTAAPGTNSTQIATTAFVLANLGGPYAPVASPAFTGIPTAPSASLGTNTTQIATTAFVISNTTGIFAPIASPTFTGVPLSPTASLGTNTDQIATCAFVIANGGSGGIAIGDPVTGGTSTYVLFVDGSGDLGQASNFTWSGSLLSVETLSVNPGGSYTFAVSSSGPAGSFSAGGTTNVTIGDGVHAITASGGNILFPGTSGNTLEWQNSVAAPSPQVVGAVPLSAFGQGAITDFLGDPDAWVLINVNGTDYKIPLYLP